MTPAEKIQQHLDEEDAKLARADILYRELKPLMSKWYRFLLPRYWKVGNEYEEVVKSFKLPPKV